MNFKKEQSEEKVQVSVVSKYGTIYVTLGFGEELLCSPVFCFSFYMFIYFVSVVATLIFFSHLIENFKPLKCFKLV